MKSSLDLKLKHKVRSNTRGLMHKREATYTLSSKPQQVKLGNKRKSKVLSQTL